MKHLLKLHNCGPVKTVYFYNKVAFHIIFMILNEECGGVHHFFGQKIPIKGSFGKIF